MTSADTTAARVERRRLLDRIAADVDGGANIIALSAPPGAGKTTTLEQWLSRRRTAGDIVLALPAGTKGDLWPGLLAAIRAGAPPASSRAIATVLSDVVHLPANDIRPERLASLRPWPASIWVLVDDAQELAQARTREQLERLLAAAQPSLRVAVGARYTPHGLLSTRLLEGAAKEYRLADLVFDRDEAEALLAVENVTLSDDDLDALLRRTGGWAAGLRLAALAMAHHDDRPAFVRNFAGTDRTVSDYLVAEVLSRLPPDSIDVLLDVSVAARVNLDLARLLTGRPDAGLLLEQLVENNALVGTVRDEPDWYELHPLLRSYLRAESRRRDETRHRRRLTVAIDWFERAGDVRNAVQHAAAATDWPRVESAITRSCSRIVMSDGPQAMSDIVRSLPAWLQARPSVTGVAALVAAVDQHLSAAELDLALLDASGDDAARRLALRAIIALAAARNRAISRDEVDEALAALDLVAGEDPDVALLGRSLASMALAMTGDLASADDAACAIAQISRNRGLDFLMLQTLGAQCAVSAFRSDLATTRARATEAIELAHRRGWGRHPRLAQFHAQLAFAEWQSGHDSVAAECARSALDVADADTDPLSAAAARCLHDLTATTPGAGLDLTVVGHLQASSELWPLLPSPGVAADACFQLMVSLRSHELDLAGAIIRRAEEVIPDTPDVQVFKAMKRVYQGHEGVARQELDLVVADECLAPSTSAVAWALTAHLADAAGEPARTLDALLNLLRQAESSHLMRGVLDAAPSIRQLLVRNRGRFGHYESFASDVLACADAQQQDKGGTGFVLTDKELEMLRDLPSMLSLREIADAHVVSINTVKSHLKSVYRKLGVSSRREAVYLAREIGLV